MSTDNEKYRATMRYAGLGTQMLVMMGLAVWGGHALDLRIGIKALCVIIFPVLALAYSLWQLIRTLNNTKK